MNGDEQKLRVVPAENLAALLAAEHDWDVYAQLHTCKELQTKERKPYLVVELADVHAVIEGKIWDNAPEAMAAARAAEPRATVKLRGKVKDWQGRPQLVIERLKVVAAGKSPEGIDADQVVDPALALVEDLCCCTRDGGMSRGQDGWGGFRVGRDCSLNFLCASVVGQTDGDLFASAALARVTLARMSPALAVQMKGLGARLC